MRVFDSRTSYKILSYATVYEGIETSTATRTITFPSFSTENIISSYPAMWTVSMFLAHEEGG